jgi:hypothetical protein
MVWGAISKKGKLLPLFIEACVKVNQDYYIEHILANYLFENAKNLHGEDSFCFQQAISQNQTNPDD